MKRFEIKLVMDNLTERLPVTPNELAKYDTESLDGIVHVI